MKVKIRTNTFSMMTNLSLQLNESEMNRDHRMQMNLRYISTDLFLMTEKTTIDVDSII